MTKQEDHETYLRVAFEEGQELPPIQIGKRVYQCSDKLGSGGHGIVFRADSGNKQFAMKICLCDPDEPWQRQIYKDEVDILKSLDHPNVVQYIDDLQSENMTIIVMEECQGGSLETLLEDAWKSHHSTKLSEEQAAPLMAGVVQVLHYLHTIGLVRQDIKLGNILIDDNGNAKVADFGNAYYGQNGRKFNDKVKTAYHAPEMANTDALSPAIDAYAFGATLYRLLVGIARATFLNLLRTSGEEDDDYGNDTDNVDDDDAEVKVAQDVQAENVQAEDVKGAQANEGDKGKEAQETAKDDHDTTNANIAEEKIKDKDKKCLCIAHISSDTDNYNASELVNQAPLPDAIR
ncbi:Serine/threonine-protein kinase plk1 [Linnemannia hyalina]|uniref:Serine/threonine-protein kinase plk1 n=1 Tax=Linnemannia hyalina TaxID=64524 RepID=A0A9P8BRG8_9FUNG|nr:Serine/threonine-protein kinase plk1 [Linnemannia hyalina]